MKQVSITVIENGVTYSFAVSYSGEAPAGLTNFVSEHIGGRPNDRK